MKKTVQTKVKTNWGNVVLTHYKDNVYLSERLTHSNYPSFAVYQIFIWNSDRQPILTGIITEDAKGFKNQNSQTYHKYIDAPLENFLQKRNANHTFQAV